MKKIFILIITGILLFSCTEQKDFQPGNELEKKMNHIAERYVKLVLNTGQYDPDYVDAYYGPDEWKPVNSLDVKNDSSGIKKLYEQSGILLDKLDILSSYNADEIQILRYKLLYKQLLAVRAKLFMLQGGTFSFDDESKALYDAEAPHYNAEYFQKIINELNKELPGNGDAGSKLIEFKKSFVIPISKLDTVFHTAIAECRKRVLNNIKLPHNENFKVEYVTGKPWGGYNWYKGNNFSLIQVNTDLPIYIDRAVDLGAHEGYPGHHVYNTLLESNLVKNRGWIEFTVYPLYSPQSLIAEGTANYGIEVVFPGDSRMKFEREILFPLAGLDASKTDKYYKILELAENLTYASNEAARNFINGRWTREETINWLKKYSLMSPERAERYFQFIEKYRSYVINYNLGKDLVKNYIEKKAGDNLELKWKLFENLISTPQTASNLMKK